MVFALIERDTVVNRVVVSDSDKEDFLKSRGGEFIEDDSLQIGFKRVDDNWIEPKEPQPTKEELLEMEVAKKEREILRRMAVEELEAEKERG